MSASATLRFFLLGAQRSGIVRLGSALASHPLVAMLVRTHWLLRISSGETPSGSQRTVPLELLRTAPQLTQLGIGPEEIRALGDLGEQPSLASVLERIATLVASAKGCSIVGDRTPYYLRCIPLLHDTLPGARVLHLIRDGREIYHSMLTDGEAVHPCDAALRWEWDVRLGRDGGANLPPRLYAEARHEELTAQPHRACAALSAFLDLPPGLDLARPKRSRARESRAGKLAELDFAANELFEATAGSLLDELGYRRFVANPGHAAREQARLAREKFTDQRRLEGDVVPADWPETMPRSGRSRVMVQGAPQSAESAAVRAEPRPFADNPRFFLVGAPESGTVRVGSILESHPEVAMLVRTHWLLRLSSGEGIPGSPRTIAIEDVIAAPELARTGLGEHDHDQLRALGDHPPLGSVLERMAALLAARSGRQFVGDRTEHYLRCIGFVHTTWPDARVIHVIRDGRRIYRSMLTAGKGTDPSLAALDWEWHVRLGRDAGRQMPAGLYSEVRHEELVADPDSGYATLFAFLGLPSRPEVTQQHLKRIRPGQRRSIAKLDAATRELFEASAGPLLDELGYPRSVPKPGAEALDKARQARHRFTRERLLDGDPLPSDWPDSAPARGRLLAGDGSRSFVMGAGAFGKKERNESDVLAAAELPRDPAFPQLPRLLDPAWIDAWLGDRVDVPSPHPGPWRIGFVRYRPARDLIVGYRRPATGSDEPQPLLLVTAIGLQDLDRRRKLSGLAPPLQKGAAPSFVAHADAAAVATMFPHDPIFGGVLELLDADRLEASAQRAWTPSARLVRRKDGPSIEIASYKPASSCLARCEFVGLDAQPCSVFARVYRDDTGAWVHRVMTALQKHAGPSGMAGFARSLGYDPPSRILFQEAVAGELLLSHSDLPALTARAARPLAITHGTVMDEADAPIDDPVRRLSLAAVGLQAAVPQLGEQLERVVSLLQQSRPTVSPVLLHGDFSPNQVLVKDGVVSILDFDLARFGDRHADVASFMARLETQGLPRPLVRAASESFRKAYEAEMGALDDDTLAWYRACAFGSIAIYAVKALRPGWMQTATGHLARAVEALEKGFEAPA